MNKITRTLIAWCFYDWASASFSIVVTTFIFSTYFTTRIAENEIIGTYQWANATSIAGLLIAFLSPIFGAIADHGGCHKHWLFFCTLLCVVSTSLLWFAYPSHAFLLFTLTCVVLGSAACEIAQVFYNAFLPSLVPRAYIGRMSGWGWGCGYLGGILALSCCLIFFVRGEPAWLDIKQMAQIRICGPFVGLWYLFFSLPLFLFVPRLTDKGKPISLAVRLGLKDLLSTLRRLPREKNIFLYLIAHMIYTDGLNTLFAFGGIYAAGTFKFSFQDVLLFGITMNIAAGLGAFCLAWVDDYIGSKKTILISLFFLTVLGSVLLILQNKYVFWGVALSLGIFVGPVQSASRTLIVRLIGSREPAAEIFGLYALSGKITAFMGPALLGFVTLLFHSQRVGMATVMLFFAVGAMLLLPVRTYTDS
ncbi:MAG TPA: MFS transporter [Gammaproteobacteria bacterium]|jgi:UMF1 family MFS transporter|nr:MFS transporter [Gammaproteobacteria bacterium]